MQNRRICIIGQGLAGTILAHKLEPYVKELSIYDVYEPGRSSSWVAGGLFNPLTGRRIQKSWMADQLFTHLRLFYPEMENKLGEKFFHELPLLRVFDANRVQNDVLSKVSTGELAPFTDLQLFKQPGFATPVRDDFGTLEVQQCGYLDTKRFLECSRNYFLEKGILKEMVLHPEDAMDSNVVYIWCTGYNPLDRNETIRQGLRPVKGELLTLDLPQIKITRILLGKGIFLIPLSNGYYRLGATYNWDLSNLNPTDEAAKDLIQKLFELLGFETEFSIIMHESGVRPATRDRRPLIGKMEKKEGHYIFNGFGSKGVSIIPYFAQSMVEHLLDQSPLPEDLHPSRFEQEEEN